MVPLATTLSRWLQLLLLCGYMASARARLGATLPSRGLELERPARAVQFFRLGAPGALMLALEAWAFDFSTFMAGSLGQTALDAHVRSATPHATHTNPHATRQPRSPGVARSAACAARLPLARGLSRQAPGAPRLAGGAAQHHLVHLYELPICNGRRRVHPRRPRSARATAQAAAAARLSIGSILLFMLSLAALKLAVRRHLGRLFTSDDDVVETVAGLVFIAALFQVSDGLQAANAGVMRGMGRQRLVAALNLFGFWLIGLPLGACLTFVAHVGVAGLWWGLAAGLACVAGVGAAVVLRTDWEAEARQARRRVGAVASAVGMGSSGGGDGGQGGRGGQTSTTTELQEQQRDGIIDVPPTPPADNVRRPHTVE